MIPYVPEPFIDRSVQYPGRRYITRPDSTVELCQISRSHEGQNAEGAIYAEGTPLNAQSFNNEMTKVKDTLDSIGGDLSGKQDQLTAGSGIVIQNNTISATGGGGGSSTYLSGLADVGLYAPQSGDVLIFDSTQGKWTNGDIVAGSGSGSVVSFADGAAGLPLFDLKTAITATQSGSGDPSPANVRPISGFTGLNLTRAGKNIANQTALIHTGVVNDTGTENTLNTRLFTPLIKVCQSTDYYFSIVGRSSNNEEIYFNRIIEYDVNGVFLRRQSVTSAQKVSCVKTTGADVYYIAIDMRTADLTTNLSASDVSALMMAKSSSAVDYEAYTETVYPVTWQTEAGTVYGGELNVTSGVLTINHTLDDLSQIEWRVRATGTTKRVLSAEVPNTYLASGSSDLDWLCDKYKYCGRSAASILINNVDTAATGIYSYSYNGNANLIYAVLEDTSATGVSANLCYELAQPVSVQLTPTEINTLLGTNNIWSDAGDITSLKYYRQQAQEIISLIQFDTSIKQWAEDRFAPLYTDVTGTLTAGQTYLILNSPKILTTSTIDIYTDTFGVAPYAIEVQNGNIRLTFIARQTDLNVKVRIS